MLNVHGCGRSAVRRQVLCRGVCHCGGYRLPHADNWKMEPSSPHEHRPLWHTWCVLPAADDALQGGTGPHQKLEGHVRTTPTTFTHAMNLCRHFSPSSCAEQDRRRANYTSLRLAFARSLSATQLLLCVVACHHVKVNKQQERRYKSTTHVKRRIEKENHHDAKVPDRRA